MSENYFQTDVRRFTRNKYIGKFLSYIPIVGFLLANIFIIIFFDYFLIQDESVTSSFETININSVFHFINPVYLLGIVFSVAFIKAKWIIRLFEKILERLQKNEIESGSEEQIKTKQHKDKVLRNLKDYLQVKKVVEKFKTFSIMLVEFFVHSMLFLRILFFNMFNEIFILMVFWSFYFFLLSIFSIISFPRNYNFTTFFSAIGMIGIIAGFFQFYTKMYQEKVTTKIENILLKYLFNYVQQEVTPHNFLIFFQHEGGLKGKIIEDFKKYMEEPYMKKEDMLEIIRAKSRFPFHLTIYNNYSRNFDVLSQFGSFDLYADSFYSNIQKITLNEMYEDFFKVKCEDFARNTKNDGLNNLRNLLLPVILFFDEMDVDLFRLDMLNNTYSEDKMMNFKKHYNKFIEDCYFSLIGDVSFTKTSERLVMSNS